MDPGAPAHVRSARRSDGAPARPPLAPIGDVLALGVRLLLCGINPGVRSAEIDAHYAGPGNRFWAALHAAGITAERLGPHRQHELLDDGVGLTNLVPRPSARADELTTAELREGARSLGAKVEALGPAAVGVLGITAYRRAFDRRDARVGRQADTLAGAILHVLPNPSGLNAHATPAVHAEGLRQLALDAGLTLHR